MMIAKQMILLFGLIGIGYLLKKIKILDDVGDNRVTRLVVNVGIPATVLHASSQQNTLTPQSTLIVMAIAVGVFILLPFVSAALTKLFHWPNTGILMLVFSNLGFMGLPIIEGMFGVEYTIYPAMFMMIFNISLFSYGVAIAAGGVKSIKLSKLLFNPAIVAAVLAMIFFFTPLEIPDAMTGLIGSLSAITTPLAMMLVGSMLANVPFREAFTDKRQYLLALLKLVVYPGLTYLILRLFISDPIILAVSTVLVGMPVGSNVSMICAEYGGDREFAVKGTFLTSLLSMLTVPFYLWVFAR